MPKARISGPRTTSEQLLIRVRPRRPTSRRTWTEDLRPRPAPTGSEGKAVTVATITGQRARSALPGGDTPRVAETNLSRRAEAEVLQARAEDRRGMARRPAELPARSAVTVTSRSHAPRTAGWAVPPSPHGFPVRPGEAPRPGRAFGWPGDGADGIRHAMMWLPSFRPACRLTLTARAGKDEARYCLQNLGGLPGPETPEACRKGRPSNATTSYRSFMIRSWLAPNGSRTEKANNRGHDNRPAG